VCVTTGIIIGAMQKDKRSGSNMYCTLQCLSLLAWAYEPGEGAWAAPSPPTPRICRAKQHFSRNRYRPKYFVQTAPKNEKKYFSTYNENMEFISSSEMNCPKSVLQRASIAQIERCTSLRTSKGNL